MRTEARRVRRVVLEPSYFIDLLCGRANITNGLPKDARLAGGFVDQETGCYTVIIESSEFDEVDEGEVIPEYEIELTYDNTD